MDELSHRNAPHPERPSPSRTEFDPSCWKTRFQVQMRRSRGLAEGDSFAEFSFTRRRKPRFVGSAFVTTRPGSSLSCLGPGASRGENRHLRQNSRADPSISPPRSPGSPASSPLRRRRPDHWTAGRHRQGPAKRPHISGRFTYGRHRLTPFSAGSRFLHRSGPLYANTALPWATEPP